MVGHGRPKFSKILDLPLGSTTDERPVNWKESQSVRVPVCQSLRISIRRSDGLSVCQTDSLSVYETDL